MRFFIQIFLFLLLFKADGYNLEFFSRFNDKHLENYIQEALLNNHDLKSADKRLEQFRYEIHSAFSKEFPSLSVSSNYLGTHFPNNDYNIFLKNNSFILPFRLNWEPDLLLKTKDKIKSKKLIYKSEAYYKESVYLSLLTDVATTYINILLYDYLIEKQQEIISNLQNKLKRNNKKLNAGIIDITDLNSVDENLNTQKTILDTLEKNRKTSIINFALLLGKSAYCVDEIKRGSLKTFEYQGVIPEEINSDLIYMRPDVKEIEHKLKSAKMDITVAKKDFFPSFNILSILSFDTAGGNFFSWNSSFAYLLAGATQDIFKGGEKIANLKIKKAKYYELVEKYKQTDLTALKEVANALNIIKQDTKNEQTSYKQLKIQKTNFISTSKKFKQGLVSNIEYLDDKNSYNQFEQVNANSKANRLIDYITLYKAVGGEL